MMRSEQQLKGTDYLSKRQVLALAKVSEATFVRALRIARGNRTSFGQARGPGLRHKFIGRSLAIHRKDLAAWLAARKRLGCRGTNPLNGLMSPAQRRRWIRRISATSRQRCAEKKKRANAAPSAKCDPSRDTNED